MAFHHAKDSRLRSAMDLAMQDTYARMRIPDFDVVYRRTYGIIEVNSWRLGLLRIFASMRNMTCLDLQPSNA